MVLANGDPVQYRELKKIPIIDYLIKLDNFVRQQEPEQTATTRPGVDRGSE